MGQFKPGVITNPKGRPPIGRSIADSLRTAMSERVKVGNRYTTKHAVLSTMIADALTTSACVTLTGKTIQLNPKLWLDLVKFVSVHIDGPMPAQLDITSGGLPVKGYIGFTLDEWDDIVEGEVIEDDPKLLNSG